MRVCSKMKGGVEDKGWILGGENEREESPINLNDKDFWQFGACLFLCHFKHIKTILMPR